jgi:hypothetical protein
MKTILFFVSTSLVSGLLAGATTAWAATESAAAEALTSPAWEVAERGQDFAVYQRVATVPQADALSVHANGDGLVGCSGSKTNEFIGAFYQGMKAGNWSRSYLLQAGRTSWTSDRWGDYSATSLDPTDDSFWTVQEFSSLAYDVEATNRVAYSIWGTWIGQIKVSF